MNLWAVFQEGVYRHSCGGIYDSVERAINAADRIAAADVDDYHHYEVVPLTLNTDNEGERVYSVDRKEALKKFGPHDGECHVPEKIDCYHRHRTACSRGTLKCIRDARASLATGTEKET